MILILILQGFSRFMDKYSELVREKFVNFKKKKEISILREGYLKDFKEKDWEGIIDEFVQNIQNEVGKDIISNLQSNFTTTNSTRLTASQVSIMSSMKQYFNYKLYVIACGVSSITLEGTKEDWEKIKSKLEFLSKKEFALGWWTKHMIPIIEKK